MIIQDYGIIIRINKHLSDGLILKVFLLNSGMTTGYYKDSKNTKQKLDVGNYGNVYLKQRSLNHLCKYIDVHLGMLKDSYIKSEKLSLYAIVVITTLLDRLVVCHEQNTELWTCTYKLLRLCEVTANFDKDVFLEQYIMFESLLLKCNGIANDTCLSAINTRNVCKKNHSEQSKNLEDIRNNEELCKSYLSFNLCDLKIRQMMLAMLA